MKSNVIIRKKVNVIAVRPKSYLVRDNDNKIYEWVVYNPLTYTMINLNDTLSIPPSQLKEIPNERGIANGKK